MSDQTYDVAAIRNWCGVTHHAGCACHEKRRDDELTALKAECEKLRGQVAKLESECLGCGQVADGWGFCDCAHDAKKEKAAQLRELFAEAVEILFLYGAPREGDDRARAFLAKLNPPR